MNALLQHRGHNLMGAGVSSYIAIACFGLIVAGVMYIIQRWHASNLRNHPDEMAKLLAIARDGPHRVEP
jgi:hypothetical protein